MIRSASPSCLLAGAGDPGYISEAARVVNATEEGLSIGSVEEAVQRIYNRFIERGDGSEKSLGYDLIVSIREEPTESTDLYHVYENGRSEKIEKGWPGSVSIGSGSIWSEWLLNQFRDSFTNSDVGLQFAVYAIEAVKEVDPNVGGEIQAGRIWLRQKGWRATTPSVSRLKILSEQVKLRRELFNSFWVIAANDPNFEQDIRRRATSYLKRESGEE